MFAARILSWVCGNSKGTGHDHSSRRRSAGTCRVVDRPCRPGAIGAAGGARDAVAHPRSAFHHLFHHRFHGPPFDYVGLAFGSPVSSAGFPGPGEALLIAGGIIAASGKLDLVSVIAIAFAGAVVGGIVGWMIGLKAGRKWGGRVCDVEVYYTIVYLNEEGWGT